MKLIAQSVPTLQDVFNANPIASKFPTGKLGEVLSAASVVIFYIVVFLTFYWLVWGAFQYLFAGGNKENLAKARARITWALVGLIIVILAYLVTQWAASIFPVKWGVPLEGVKP